MEQSTPQYTWNGIDLETLRHIMDKPSDDAVASAFESNSMKHLTDILKGMAENDDFVSHELPPAMHDFVQKELQFSFSEQDIEMFNRTHKIWKEHGMKFVFILFFRALPYTYMAEKPANVLRMTRLLQTQTERRVIETAQFVFDVMEKEWWTPKKRGILTALKIRIMHSAMRHIILDSKKTGEKWNKEWGQPISQEDLIATNQVFSLEFFKGMEMIGQPLSREEQEAWFHTWKTIAKIMGVQENLICDSVDEAWELQHTIYAHLFKDETHAGIPLAKALVETIAHFHMPHKLVLFLMKTMLADEQFPDCFERMLGPSYAEKYPELFIKHDSEEEREKHKKEVLHKQLHSHALEYYNTVKENETDIKHPRHKTGLFERIVIWFFTLLGISDSKVHLIEIHLEQLHKILHDIETGEPLETLEEDAIIDMITVFGGIMVAILAAHFREGKESGFRIPKDLQDNWALKG